MSRLIDADALMKQMIRRKEFVGRPSDPVCLVADAPTIDAVPVKEFCEWLEECRCNIFKEAFVINVQLFRAAMEKGEKNERD